MPEQTHAGVVLLPGWGFDGQVFTDLAAVLAQKYNRNIKILDLPGYGDSKKINIQAGLDALIEPLISLFPVNTNLIGWSLGGMAAIRIARQLKNRISSIILLASTPCFVKKQDWPHGIDQWQINRMSRQLHSLTGVQKVLRDFSMIVAMGDRVPKKTVARLHTLLSTNEVDGATLQHGLNVLAASDLREDITQLSCRVVMLLGENDRLIANTTGLATKELCPSLLLDYIPHTGHAPFVSELNRTAALLAQHLD